MAKKNQVSESDLQRISTLFLQGYSENEISVSTNLSKTVVKDALKTLRKRFLDETEKDKEELRSIEVAKSNHLERIYWDGFEKSKTFTVKTVVAEGQEKTVMVRSESGAGNPQFLVGVERCATRRIRLLGLEKSTETEVSETLRLLEEVVKPDEPSENEDR